MKIIQLFQRDLILIYGIGLNQQPWNWKILLALLDFCASILSCSVYFFNKTETLQDYANSTCICAAQIGVAILLVCFATSMQTCFGYINEAEQIIDGSKLVNPFNNQQPFESRFHWTINFRARKDRFEKYLWKIQSLGREIVENHNHCSDQGYVSELHVSGVNVQLLRLFRYGLERGHLPMVFYFPILVSAI